MTENQIKIADNLLSYLASGDGKADIDQYSNYLIHNMGYEWKDASLVRDQLLKMDFIDYLGDQQYYIILTEKGWEATKYGITKTLSNQKDEKVANKNWYSYVMLILAILSGIAGIIGILLILI